MASNRSAQNNKQPEIGPSISETQTANGLTGGLKPTFLEGFSKVYSYPYGNSFLPREQSLNYKDSTMGYWNNVMEPVSLENTITGISTFERTTARKRNLRPFHVDCRTTKRRICYCPTNSVMKGVNSEKEEIRVQSMMLASDLLNYYEGFEPDFEERMQRKVTISTLTLLA